MEAFLFYIAHFFGIIASITFLYSDMQEDDLNLDKYYTIGNLFFLMHLLLLKSFIPCITVFLAILRNTLNKIYKNNDVIKYSFLTVFFFIFAFTILFSEHWILSLPAFVSLIMTFAFLYTKGNVLTYLSIFCSFLWLIVGVYINSYSVVFLEAVSIFLLIFRFYKQNKESS
jgi:hypothetical protein